MIQTIGAVTTTAASTGSGVVFDVNNAIDMLAVTLSNIFGSSAKTSTEKATEATATVDAYQKMISEFFKQQQTTIMIVGGVAVVGLVGFSLLRRGR